MAKTKWIVCLLGWIAFGPIGALIGFVLGTAVDEGTGRSGQFSGYGSGPRTDRSTGQGSPYRRSYNTIDAAYAVLEISPSATDDEVKSAYRRMAMQNHPDKVATLGPEVQKAAEEKFRKIQEAYDTIKKQRGIV